MIADMATLQMQDKNIVFQFTVNNIPEQYALNLNYKELATRFFSQEIPSEAELEYAINFIEDELMRETALHNRKSRLVTNDTAILELFENNGRRVPILSRQNIEDIFSTYARVVRGTPAASLQVNAKRNDFALLLLIREIMHHLGFAWLELQEA